MDELDEELFAGAIVYCPVCATNVDVDEEGWIEEICNNCSTQFKVFIDRNIIAEHAMVG
jgi:hypothetical protein